MLSYRFADDFLKPARYWWFEFVFAYIFTLHRLVFSSKSVKRIPILEGYPCLIYFTLRDSLLVLILFYLSEMCYRPRFWMDTLVIGICRAYIMIVGRISKTNEIQWILSSNSTQANLVWLDIRRNLCVYYCYSSPPQSFLTTINQWRALSVDAYGDC